MAISDSSVLDNLGFIYPKWPAPENVKSISTTRSGGVSEGVFTSNNLALHVEDDAKAVEKNRENLVKQGKLPSSPKWLTQIHSTITVDYSEKLCEADASYTNQSKQVCVVMTADCLPVLLCDNKGTQIAAVHAGWRGLLNGVIEDTLSKFSGEKVDILVWLGPAISQTAFEVGHEVYDAFVSQNCAAKKHFKSLENNKYLADIYGLARLRLSLAGVTSVYGGEYCTFTDEERFYSYRRDGACGRMASLIWLDK